MPVCHQRGDEFVFNNEDDFLIAIAKFQRVVLVLDNPVKKSGIPILGGKFALKFSHVNGLFLEEIQCK